MLGTDLATGFPSSRDHDPSMRGKHQMISQWIKDALCGRDRAVISYPNGGFLNVKKEDSAFIQYHTDDCVWFRYIDGEYQVCRIHTYDDVRWNC
jgi:hypothetical protein